MRRLLHNLAIPSTLLDPNALHPDDVVDIDLNPVVRRSLILDDGLVQEITPVEEVDYASWGEEKEDLGGRIVTPRFLDVHVHLDKAHTWDRAPNRSGTFAEALQVLGADKEHWTEEDVYERAHYTLSCAYAYGTSAVRTHIDTGLPWAERSYRAMARLMEDWKGKLELQVVSLGGVDQYDTPEGPALADLPLKYGASAIGGMPLMNPELDRQLDALIRLADERGTGLDLHVDESGDPEAHTLLAVAEAVLRNRFEGPVNCGHCCSLAVLENSLAKRTLDLVGEAGIAVTSLPLCNLYLQDRFSTEAPKTSNHITPFWRGVTLLNEWMDQGTITACASDNVRDAFYAYGDLDAFEVLLAGVRVGHLDNHLARIPSVVTTAPAIIMGLENEYGYIAVGREARFISFDSTSFSQWLSRPQQARRLFERDSWIEPKLPAYPHD